MRPKLLLTERAELDLEELSEFVAQDSPSAALRLVKALRARCEGLRDFPLAAPLRPEIATGIRVAVVSRHLLLYSVRDDVVVV